MKKTFAEQITEATTRVDQLTAELAAANAANLDAAAAITQRDEALAKLTAEHAAIAHDLANALESAKQQSEQVATLAARITELEASAQTADQIAGERLANVAAEPAPQLTVAAPATKDELWAQYHALKDPTERRAFWLRHKQTLS